MSRFKIDATSREDLLSKLPSIDISVPARGKGRTKEHTERWTIVKLLSTLAAHERLPFPLSAVSRDRPDILIKTPSQNIGVEITEAISPQFAQYCAIANKEFSGTFLEPAHFRWNSPNLSPDQMRKLLSQSQLSSNGWEGEAPELEWSLFIQSAIDSKLAKLAKAEFEKFDRNWIAIYDNLPYSGLNLARGITNLRPLLSDCWRTIPGFDSISIEHQQTIVILTEEGFNTFDLN